MKFLLSLDCDCGHAVLRTLGGRPGLVAPPFGPVAGPATPDHFVGVVVGVAFRRKILRKQFGGSKRQRRALGLPVSDHRFDALGIQNASERRANTS